MQADARPLHCADCGTPWARTQILCACGGRHPTAGGVVPTRQTSADSLRLTGPWAGLGAWTAGSVVSVTGRPGAGKSTLLAELVRVSPRATWATSEQTIGQVGAMFSRLAIRNPLIRMVRTSSDVRAAILETPSGGLLLLDSLTHIGGWTEQAAILEVILRWTRDTGGRAAVVLQINARGEAAGLLELPHLVDATLAIEVDPVTGSRSLSASKNRMGPLFTSIFDVDASGLTEPSLGDASYSVEGAPGGYTLHPWPMPGARWAGLLDAVAPAEGVASAAILAPSYARRVLEPRDVAGRRAFAAAHGLRWLDPDALTDAQRSKLIYQKKRR